MSLQCHKCSSRNTEVVKAKELAEKTGDTAVLTMGSGVVGIELLGKLFEALGALFGWMKEKEAGGRSVVVCKDCGYWEKV